eukprot:4284181-Lingulodinium_polyedra.AAC.1
MTAALSRPTTSAGTKPALARPRASSKQASSSGRNVFPEAVAGALRAPSNWIHSAKAAATASCTARATWLSGRR